MTKPTKKYRYAQALAKKGFNIFPLKPNGKTPVHKGWQTEAKPDAAPWANGEDFNIGLSCGKKLVVFDIDMKGGVDGESTWAGLGIKESPFQAKTPTGGRHVFFNAPENIRLSNSVSKIGPGVDVRADGGYVVAIGSTIDGVEYLPVNKGATIANLPPKATRLCRSKVQKVNTSKSKDTPVGDLDTQTNIEQAKNYLARAPLSVQGSGGDAAAFGVAAKVRDMGISENKCLELMLGGWNENCSPPWGGDELRVKVENAYKYSSNNIGAETPEAQFADEPDSAPVQKRKLTLLERYNRDFALVTIGTGYVILREERGDDGKKHITLHSEQAFHRLTVSDSYIGSDNKRHYFSKEWIVSPQRRTYIGFTFFPGEIGAIKGAYNHWCGFTRSMIYGLEIKEAKKQCNLYLEHLRDEICGGDQGLYRWLLNFFAHMIQYPEKKPETSIVLRGGKGTGKSLVFDVIGELMRDNYIITADKRMLIGNFNSHMEKALLVQFEEAFWAGDKQAEGKLKMLVTSKLHMIERKGFEPYMVKNYLRIGITSNEEWAVPASEDERRWAIFQMTGGKAGNKEYFKAIFDQLENGGYEALMTVLAGIDVNKTNVHIAPQTVGLADQKVATLDCVGSWLLTSLEEGEIEGMETGFDDGWMLEVSAKELYDAYKYHAKDRGFRYPKTQNVFARHMRKMLGSDFTKTRLRRGSSRKYVYRMGDLNKSREKFGEWLGHPITWDNEDR